MLSLNYRIFSIWLILLLCLGVFTTGVSRACLCEETCLNCKSKGLHYETEAAQRPLCGICCSEAGGIPSSHNKMPDMAGSSTGDHREKGSDPTADTTIILAHHLFDNHPLPYFARTPCVGATIKASPIHLQNHCLLL